MLQTTNMTRISVAALDTAGHDAPKDTIGWLDEDSHADMHCAGANCVVLSRTG